MVRLDDICQAIRFHQARNYGACPKEFKVSREEMTALEYEFNSQRNIFPVDVGAPYYEGIKIMGVPIVMEHEQFNATAPESKSNKVA